MTFLAVKKKTAFYSRHADVSLHIDLCMVYTGPIGYGIAVLKQVHILYVPLESGGNIPNGCVGVTRPTRLSAEGLRAPDYPYPYP